MQAQRRLLLRSVLAGATLSLAVGAGLLTPRVVLAAWPRQAFAARKLPGAMHVLFGNVQLVDSPEVKVKAPDIAENGPWFQSPSPPPFPM